MLKRVLPITLAGIALLIALLVTNFGRNLPIIPWSDPVYTEEIPEARPVRLDRRLLARFRGRKIERILTTLIAEQNKQRSAVAASATTEDERLLQSLPVAPLPFESTDIPLNEAWLKDFVLAFQNAETEAEAPQNPSATDLWKFNLALSALHISPDQLPESLRQVAVTSKESDVFPLRFVQQQTDLDGVFTMGNFDADSDIEIIDRNGTRLSDVAEGDVLISRDEEIQPFQGNGLYPWDYDSDGDTDLLITRGGRLPDSLMRNDGTGRFDDVTVRSGLLAFSDTSAAAWVDFDRDGLTDLLIGSTNHPLQLYRQTKSHKFEPIAWDLGLWLPRGTAQIETGDLNRDGYPDLFLGIDGLPDRVYLSEPAPTWESWRFTDITAEAGLSRLKNSLCRFIDFDNDGDLDLLMSPRDESDASLQLFLNMDGRSFIDGTKEVEIPAGIRATALGVIDIDNDGFEDIVIGTGPLEMNRLLWNRGGVAVREVSISAGFSFLDQPQQIQSLDLGTLGSRDLVYRNERGAVTWLTVSGESGGWVRLNVRGHVPGAKVTLSVRDPDWVLNEFNVTMGFSAQSTLGIGRVDVIETLEVSLPGMTTPSVSLEKIQPSQEVEIALPAAKPAP